MSGKQIEFGLSVPVCAWCKQVDPAPRSANVSHGICPRHFRKLSEHPVTSPRRRQSAARPLDRNDELVLPLWR